MTRYRLINCAAALAIALGVTPGAQAPASATFEVASVKPNRSGEQSASVNVRPGGQLEVRNNTLRNIIRNVYQLQDFQIVGGPEWLSRDRFDINAKAPSGDVMPQQMLGMARALLADRFSLVVHSETREMPVDALVLARAEGRSGPQLRAAAFDCSTPPAGAARGAPIPDWPPGRGLCGTRALPGRVIGGGITMADLARNVSNFAGRLTIDRTGLTGRYDLLLEWTPDQLPLDLPPGLPAPPADGPSLFTAVQEQLGLRLDSQRAPVEVLVIDSASQPSPD